MPGEETGKFMGDSISSMTQNRSVCGGGGHKRMNLKPRVDVIRYAPELNQRQTHLRERPSINRSMRPLCSSCKVLVRMVR